MNQGNQGFQTDTTSKALRGVHSQTLIVILKGITSLVYFSIMSRLLTPDDFGFFALITAVTTILTSLSEAGLGSAVIQKHNASKAFISTAFTMSLILGVIFSGLLFWGSSVFSDLTTGTDNLSYAYKMMSVIILLQAANNITWSLYMRNLDFFKYGILQITADVLSYITGIIFALKGFGYYAIVAGVVSNQIFLTIILIVMKKYQFSFMIDREYVREILSYGGWLTAAVVTRNLTNQIDKIIIGRILPIADLGALNRPQGFIDRISTQINSVVDTVLFPILSSVQNDKEKVARGYIKIIALVVTFSTLLAGVIGLGTKIIIDIFFGSQWEHLQPILAIFSFAMVVHGFSRVCDSFFRSLGIVKKYFFARLINWTILITFVISGCQFGIWGAAIAIVAGTVVSCFIKFLMQRNEVGINLGQLMGTISRSIAMPLICLSIGLICRLWLPYGDYVGLIVFVLITLVTILIFPNTYSPAFREIVIRRYFKR